MSVLPVAFVGLGYGFLFCGVAYERVRDLIGPDDAVAVAAALVGFFWLLPVEALQGLRLGVGSVVEIALSLVFGVAFGMGIGILYRYDESRVDGLDARHVVVLAVAMVGVAGVTTEVTELPRAASDVMWVAVLGLAVFGYERARSVWIPVLSIVVFEVVLVGVVYAESLLGLAAL